MTTKIDRQIREMARRKLTVRVTEKRISRSGFIVTFPVRFDQHGWHYDEVNVPSLAEAKSLLKVRLKVFDAFKFTIKKAKKKTQFAFVPDDGSTPYCGPCRSYHVVPKDPAQHLDLQCFDTFNWIHAHTYRHESENHPDCPLCQDRKAEDKP